MYSILDKQLEQIALAIGSDGIHKNTVRAVDRLLDLGEAESLIRALLSQASPADPDSEKAVRKTMDRLEAFAADAPIAARTLMAALWPRAGSNPEMHDVADSIDLWIEDSNSSEMICRLKSIAERERNPKYRRHYEILVEFLVGKS